MSVRPGVLAGLFLAILSLAVEASPENNAVDWAADGASIGTLHLTLSRSDKRDMIALAAAMGLANPARVELDPYVPGLCTFVRVRSVAVEEGNRRSWLELRMRLRQWPACDQPEPGASVRRVGRWIAASSDLATEERWRIRDGADWSVDVELDDREMYRDAESIVKAIRRNALVNRVPPIDLPVLGSQMVRPLPEVTATDTSSIRRDAKTPGGYVVAVGRRAGQILYVRIVNETVEVYELSSWIQ
jgi:hypothetical protein